MELMRESWTDERMDDLNHRVDNGFGRVDADLRSLRSDTMSEFAAVRSEIKSEFAAVRSEMKAGFDRIEAKFDAKFDDMHRTMIQFAGLMVAALIALFGAQIGLIVSLA